MSPYRCVMTLIHPGNHGRNMLHQAHRLAKLHGARLVAASLVDFDSGCECDHIPFKTPQETLALLVGQVNRQLQDMTASFKDVEIQCQVVTGYGRQPCLDLVAALEVDLLVVDPATSRLLVAPAWFPFLTPAPPPCDILVLHTPTSNLMGRLRQSWAGGVC